VAEDDEVRLTVPAMPEFLRLARVTAAGLASRMGFSLDQVEDLRLAIDELCFTLTGSHGRPGGSVEMRYLIGDDYLEVCGEGHFGGAHQPPQLSELSEVILSALVDEHEVSGRDGGPRFWLLKRLSDRPTS
jgi:serine/threonine-protein kinase RsbW